MSTPEECVLFRKQGRMAIITLNIPSKLNAMNSDNYYRLSCLMRDIAKYLCSNPTPQSTD
jgi:Delta3-Delta2-enoyl-CoA isomerase